MEYLNTQEIRRTMVRMEIGADSLFGNARMCDLDADRIEALAKTLQAIADDIRNPLWFLKDLGLQVVEVETVEVDDVD